MGKGYNGCGSQSLVRITTEGRTLLETLRTRFQKTVGNPVSFATALLMAFRVAERMTSLDYQKKVAADLGEHTRRNIINTVSRLIGERPVCEISIDKKSYKLRLTGRPSVVVADNNYDLTAALARATGQPKEHLMGH